MDMITCPSMQDALMGRRRVVVLVALLVLCLPPVFAQNVRQMRSDVEASMLVTGTVDIERDGAVSGYALDQKDKLPSQVTSLVHGFVPQMRFEPVLNEQLPGPDSASLTLTTAGGLHTTQGRAVVRHGRIPTRPASAPTHCSPAGFTQPSHASGC
ncbi:hypothetical protein MNO14_01530 [Luteimonas sp. S4-F44]|uniref:hypothetical protein n=1 Tax=Luteimonas sp. S4-F44 TaxID=2925842 RepID=UPI001F5316CB|nr:hypothetical protein [Luteimonas sp. S4-F44]UNK42815.1 hypothetical protein MNO14_01530 [Luteimonas sp. S4-F44]